MQSRINKIIWSFVFILGIAVFLGIIYDKNTKRKYNSKFYYMDTYIYIDVYMKDSKKANKALKEAENIYKEYHELTDRFNSYNNINNLYYIKNNKSSDEYIKIDKKLYSILKYSIDAYNKTDGLIDISIGNITSKWSTYRKNKNGVPSIDELKSVNDYSIDDIVLKDGNLIKNNHVNIDLGCIAKGYTTKIVGEYFKKNGINEFLINAGGNVLVGDNYKNSKYYIGIEDPNNKGDIFTIVRGNNISVVTSGGYERYYEYNGVKYHHIINPKTLYPSNFIKSVSVISSDSSLSDILSTYLFLVDVDTGREYIDSLDNVEAIWYTNDDKIIKSKGYKKYE